MNKQDCLINLFKYQAESHPDKTAIEFENQTITYRQLDMLSDLLASRMIEQGVKAQDFVLLASSKSIEMVIGIFASIKAGTIYVPVDKRFPKDRIEFIISDCKPSLILVHNFEIANNTDVNQMEIDMILPRNGFTIEYKQSSTNIDYCIYTSGTTGKPKGVLIYDYSVVNLVKAYQRIYGITDKDVLLQFASLAFDQSVWDIFTILCTGGVLCILPENMFMDISKTEQYINEHKVSVAALTPEYLKLLHPGKLPSIRVIESGGDKIEREVVIKWKKYCRVFNTYGPTEATVNALSYELLQDIPFEIPIGKPIDNMEAFIISETGELCDNNVVGELCLSGVGIADGYLNNEKLTRIKFTPNPYGTGILYHTGDLAKRLDDGNYVCIGRKDSEIKIRGFRVDIGEIESVLQRYGDACVRLEKTKCGTNTLVAYIVSTIQRADIISRIKEILPDYMIPSMFIYLESLPLNINGKIDNAKLHESYIKAESMIPILPITEFQKATCKILESILGVYPFGINYNFLEYGGNSILAIMAVTELLEAGFSCSPVDLLRSTDVMDFEARSKKSTPPIESKVKINRVMIQNLYSSRIKGISPITPTQHYMYRAYKSGIVGDNILQYMYVVKYPFNLNVFKQAIKYLPVYFDSLTSNFYEDIDGSVYQITFDNKEIPIYEVDIKDNNIHSLLKQDINNTFDLLYGSLVRIYIIYMNNNDVKMLLSISHMVVDGWSIEIILSVLSSLYQILSKNGVVDFKSPLSINEYNLALYEHIEYIYADAIEYWNRYFFNSKNAVLTVHGDRFSNSSKYHFLMKTINTDDMDNIRRRTARLKISDNVLFELAMAYLIYELNGCINPDILFSKVVSGRDIRLKGIDKMVGTLINIIPQRIYVSRNYLTDIKTLHSINLSNMEFDKIDFYKSLIDGRFIMETVRSMIVFSNYYDDPIEGFEYEFDRDQDDVDFTFYVDRLRDSYRVLLTCKEEYYSCDYAESMLNKYISIVLNIVSALY